MGAGGGGHVVPSRQAEFTQKTNGWQRVGFPTTPSAQPRLSLLLLGFHLLRIEIVSSFLNLSVSYLPGAGGETASAAQPDVICVYRLC